MVTYHLEDHWNSSRPQRVKAKAVLHQRIVHTSRDTTIDPGIPPAILICCCASELICSCVVTIKPTHKKHCGVMCLLQWSLNLQKSCEKMNKKTKKQATMMMSTETLCLTSIATCSSCAIKTLASIDLCCYPGIPLSCVTYLSPTCVTYLSPDFPDRLKP